MKTPVPLLWEANIFARNSFSVVTCETARALRRRPEIDLTLLPIVPHDLDPGLPEFAEITPICAQNKPPKLGGVRPVFVRIGFPLRAYPPPRATWVIYQPWEMTMIPVAMAEIMRRAHEVWTTSQFCVDAYVRSGVPAEKIRIMPHGVDPTIFRPDGPRAELPEAKPFRFLFVGGSIFRKGIDVLLKAYGRAFTSHDPVTLIIKDSGGRYPTERGTALIADFARDPEHPHVLHLGDHLGEGQLPELYRASDVFVSSYRGEGFCLPALEAMACGLPVMVTRGGATDDFVDEAVGWRIPAQLRPANCRSVFNMPIDFDAERHEPDVDALAELLREAFRNESKRRARGKAAAERAAKWTWDAAADKMVTRCLELAP